MRRLMGLGASDAPDSWKSNVFDPVWEIRFDNATPM
jgi:hypothetical protein